MNPAEWLQRAATRDPDAPALFRGAHQVANYGEFLRSAAGIGAALGAQGIGPGSRVAVFMANRTEYLEALYGIWFCGAAAVPISAAIAFAFTSPPVLTAAPWLGSPRGVYARSRICPPGSSPLFDLVSGASRDPLDEPEGH